MSPEAPAAQGRRLDRELTREFGTTYYWGTLFLPAHRRDDVYALYALCRLADDIVDEPLSRQRIELDVPADALPAERLAAFADRFYRCLLYTSRCV